MRRRLIGWGLIILFALVMYLFSNETVTLALLAAVIIVVPASYALLKFTGRRFEVSITEPNPGAEKSWFTLCMRNGGLLPIASAEMETVCSNLRTGESDMLEINRSIRPRGTVRIPVEVTPANAGRYMLRVPSVRITDPLGLWSRIVECEDAEFVTFLPEIFDLQLVPAGSAAMPESDKQSQKSRGSVAGDMTGIREYVPGDPVRNIHWKLSEKTDRMLVKELGVPVTDRLLLILDSAAEIAQDPVALNTVASVFASLIRSLRQHDFVFSVAWTDPETGEAVIRRIESEDDETAAADEYLAVPASAPSAFRRIERDITENRYAHVVIVGPRIPEEIENIANGCEATVLMYGTNEYFTDKNLTVIGFEAGSFMSDVAGLEV